MGTEGERLSLQEAAGVKGCTASFLRAHQPLLTSLPTEEQILSGFLTMGAGGVCTGSAACP